LGGKNGRSETVSIYPPPNSPCQFALFKLGEKKRKQRGMVLKDRKGKEAEGKEYIVRCMVARKGRKKAKVKKVKETA